MTEYDPLAEPTLTRAEKNKLDSVKRSFNAEVIAMWSLGMRQAQIADQARIAINMATDSEIEKGSATGEYRKAHEGK